MIDLGKRAGREVTCLLTDMDQPLGRAVGNALEIREHPDTVRGEGPADFTELVLDASGAPARVTPISTSTSPRAGAGQKPPSPTGNALAMYDRWVRAQGGDPDPPRTARRARRASPFPRRATASSSASARLRWGSPRSSSAPAAGRRPTRSTTPSAPLLRQARRHRARGRRPRRGPRARRGVCDRRRPGRARGVHDRRRAAAPQGILLDVLS